MKVNVLGTEYTISEKSQKEDALLIENDGYFDAGTKDIVIANDLDDGSIYVSENLNVTIQRIKRHELIHAFLHESGLNNYCTNETIVDWMALQFPKMLETFKEVGAI